MRSIGLNYLTLIACLVLGALSNGFPRSLAWAEPWLSLATLGLMAAVGIRVFRGEAKGEASGQDESELRHLRRQKAVILLFVVSGVVSAFQWALYFKHLSLGFDANAILQLVTSLISIAAVAMLAFGSVVFLRGRRPAVTAATLDETPETIPTLPPESAVTPPS